MLLKKRLFLLLCSAILLFPTGHAAAAKSKLSLQFSYTTDLRTASLTIPFQWEVTGGTPPYQISYSLHSRSRQSADDPVPQGNGLLESMFRTEASGQGSFVLDDSPDQFYWFDFYIKDAMGNSKRFKEVGHLATILPPRLTATPGDGCVHLAWDSHEFDHGQYRLYRYEDNQYHMICEGDSFLYQDYHYTHLAENLENGKPYTFIVQAKTDEGWSNLHENFHVTVTPLASEQNPQTEDMLMQRWARELAEIEAKAQITLGDGPIKCHLWMDRTEISSGETLTLQWAFSGGTPPYLYDFMLPSDIDIMRQSARGVGGQASFSIRPGCASGLRFNISAKDSEGQNELFSAEDPSSGSCTVELPIQILDAFTEPAKITFDQDTVAIGKPITATVQTKYNTGEGVYPTHSVCWVITDAKGAVKRYPVPKKGAFKDDLFERVFELKPKSGVSGVLEVNISIPDGENGFYTVTSSPFSITK